MVCGERADDHHIVPVRGALARACIETLFFSVVSCQVSCEIGSAADFQVQDPFPRVAGHETHEDGVLFWHSVLVLCVESGLCFPVLKFITFCVSPCSVLSRRRRMPPKAVRFPQTFSLTTVFASYDPLILGYTGVVTGATSGPPAAEGMDHNVYCNRVLLDALPAAVWFGSETRFCGALWALVLRQDHSSSITGGSDSGTGPGACVLVKPDGSCARTRKQVVLAALYELIRQSHDKTPRALSKLVPETLLPVLLAVPRVMQSDRTVYFGAPFFYAPDVPADAVPSGFKLSPGLEALSVSVFAICVASVFVSFLPPLILEGLVDHFKCSVYLDSSDATPGMEYKGFYLAAFMEHELSELLSRLKECAVRVREILRVLRAGGDASRLSRSLHTRQPAKTPSFEWCVRVLSRLKLDSLVAPGQPTGPVRLVGRPGQLGEVFAGLAHSLQHSEVDRLSKLVRGLDAAGRSLACIVFGDTRLSTRVVRQSVNQRIASLEKDSGYVLEQLDKAFACFSYRSEASGSALVHVLVMPVTLLKALNLVSECRRRVQGGARLLSDAMYTLSCPIVCAGYTADRCLAAASCLSECILKRAVDRVSVFMQPARLHRVSPGRVECHSKLTEAARSLTMSWAHRSIMSEEHRLFCGPNASVCAHSLSRLPAVGDLNGKEEWRLVDYSASLVATDCNSFEFDLTDLSKANSKTGEDECKRLLCNPMLLEELLHRSPLTPELCGSEFCENAVWFAQTSPLVDASSMSDEESSSEDDEKARKELVAQTSAASSSSSAAAAVNEQQLPDTLGGSPQYQPPSPVQAPRPLLTTVSMEDYPVPANILTGEE